MNTLLIVSLIANVLYFFLNNYKNRRVKKLLAEKPVLDLKKFEKLYEESLTLYGAHHMQIVVLTCFSTAQLLNAENTIHEDMHKELNACEANIKTRMARIAEAEQKLVARTNQLRKSQEANIRIMHQQQVIDRTRIQKIREMHDRV